MEKYIFLTDCGTDTYSELKKLLLKNNYKTASVYESGLRRTSDMPDKTEICFPWNPVSAVSAKNAVLKAGNDETFSTAVIFFPAFQKTEDLHAVSSMELQEKLDINFKSRFFLLKELSAYFSKNTQGRIFIIFEEKIRLNPYKSFFKTYIKAASKDIKIPVLSGIENPGLQPAEFAQLIFKIISWNSNLKSGRWFSRENPFFYISIWGSSIKSYLKKLSKKDK